MDRDSTRYWLLSVQSSGDELTSRKPLEAAQTERRTIENWTEPTTLLATACVTQCPSSGYSGSHHEMCGTVEKVSFETTNIPALQPCAQKQQFNILVC